MPLLKVPNKSFDHLLPSLKHISALFIIHLPPIPHACYILGEIISAIFLEEIFEEIVNDVFWILIIINFILWVVIKEETLVILKEKHQNFKGVFLCANAERKTLEEIKAVLLFKPLILHDKLEYTKNGILYLLWKIYLWPIYPSAKQKRGKDLITRRQSMPHKVSIR